MSKVRGSGAAGVSRSSWLEGTWERAPDDTTCRGCLAGIGTGDRSYVLNGAVYCRPACAVPAPDALWEW